MAIDYTVDIVQDLFESNVASETAYQPGGDFNLPAAFGLLSLREATIVAPGTNYLADDEITLSGGTFDTAAILKVLTVGIGGEVLTFSILEPGAYETVPTGTLSTTDNSLAGSGFTATATWDGLGEQRLLTFIEIMRSYLDEIESVHEAKMLQEIMGRTMSSMKFGGVDWNIRNGDSAQIRSLNFIASISNLEVS